MDENGSSGQRRHHGQYCHVVNQAGRERWETRGFISMGNDGQSCEIDLTAEWVGIKQRASTPSGLGLSFGQVQERGFFSNAPVDAFVLLSFRGFRGHQ